MTTPKKYFPIKTEPACQFKWAWSTLYLSNGTTNSCHRVGGGHISPEKFGDFHNTPSKIRDREMMLAGQWPGNECNYCKRIEDSGGLSERQTLINPMENVCPPELLEDPTASRVTPTILEVYFSNKCNQSCVYCSPMFSSAIQAEIEKHGPMSDRYQLHGRWEQSRLYDHYVSELWKWMDKNSTHLRLFHILGGEPFYQEEFDQCISFFERTNNPMLAFRIFSNLKHPYEAFKKKIDRLRELTKLKKLAYVEIICSIDAWGPEIEYARHGLKMDQWEKNFQYLVDSPEIKACIHMTLSPVTLPASSALVDKVKDASEYRVEKYGKGTEIAISYNIIANPPFMDPGVFGHHLRPFMDTLVESCQWLHDGGIIEGYRQQVCSSEIRPQMMAELRDYLTELDRRRGTSWREVYPWMSKIIDETVGDRSPDSFDKYSNTWTEKK